MYWFIKELPTSYQTCQNVLSSLQVHDNVMRQAEERKSDEVCIRFLKDQQVGVYPLYRNLQYLVLFFRNHWVKMARPHTYIHIIFSPPANEVCEVYVFTPVCQSFCSRGGGGGVRGKGARVCVAGACVGGGACVAGGGMRGQGVCMPRMPPPDTTRYGQSMRGRYATYWNAFLFVGNV